VKAIRAKVIYTGIPGKVIKNAYIVWENDVIKEITKDAPKDAVIVDENPENVITPAFVDPHCHIGMHRAGEPTEEAEANEEYDSVLPHVDALYSIYMDDKSFKESIEWGVLYSCVLPGSGNIIGGKGVVIRNYAKNVEEAFIKHAGVKAALGFNPRRTTNWKGLRPYTRMGSIGVFRKWLIKAKDALKLIEQGKKVEEEFDPELRMLFPIVKGEEILRVHVHKEDDIICLLMLRREFNLRITVEHACDVHSKEMFQKLKKENVPIVYGPIDSFPYKTELKHESWRNVKYLVEVKPFFGLMTDHPVVPQRNLYLQLRFFIKYGMSKDEALSIITLNNAKILGIDDKLGSLEQGKWASFTVWNNDPFLLGSTPKLVVAEGKVVYKEE